MTSLQADVVGTGPRLVLAHGFTQTGRLWGPLGDALARRHEVVRVDLPGHAGSSEVAADLPRAADLLVRAGGDAPEPFDLLGYSLGARIALHAALAHPGRVRRLVLVGATAGIEDPEARRRRRARDVALADALEARAETSKASSAVGWPPRCSPGCADAGLEERLRNTAAGLASSLRLAGTGTQVPLWGRLGEITQPVLVLVGADDARFVAAGARLAASLGDGVFSLVPGAGHAAHLAQPRLTDRLVETFLGDAAGDRLITTIPTTSSRPTASCSRPVAPSTGRRAPPRAPPATVRTGDRAIGAASSARRAHGRQWASSTTPRAAAPSEPDVEPTGPGPAQAHRHRSLPRRLVPVDVAQVVGLQQRRGQQPHRERRRERHRGERTNLDVGRPHRGHQPEEDEHEHLAETEVAVGFGPPGVEPARRHSTPPRPPAATTT